MELNMKLDKKKILGEAEDYFGSKRYGDGTYSLSEECVGFWGRYGLIHTARIMGH